jgi:hypothetical protein
MSNDPPPKLDHKQNQKRKKVEKKEYLAFLKGQVTKHKE